MSVVGPVRRPNQIVRENIRAQMWSAGGVDADKVVQALRNEGWHLVSSPEWHQGEEECVSWGMPLPVVKFNVRVFVDDTIVEGEDVVTRNALEGAMVDVGEHVKRRLASQVRIKVAELVGLA